MTVIRLGDQLRAPDGPSDDALRQLEELLAYYDDAKAQVQQRLSDLGLSSTGRLKTTTTLIEKLRREYPIKLRAVHDVAGARVVLDGGHLEQDAVVAKIVRKFADASKAPLVRDRRQQPSHGYRAVHVIVWVDDIPVEVQVRTGLQDAWAQAMESLADRWGRCLRYGELPPDADADPHGIGTTKRGVYEQLLEVADMLHAEELRFAQVAGALSSDSLAELTTRLNTLRQNLHRLAAALREVG